MIWDIALTAAMVVLLLLVEHYWPWQAILRRELGIIPKYVSGILAIYIPLTFLLIIWGNYDVVIALWAVTICGGAAVQATHWLDAWILARDRARIAEHEAQHLRPGVGHGPDDC